MKTYTYQKPYFQIEVIAVGVFCAAIGIWSIWAAATGSSLGGILILIAIVCAYQVANTFVCIANPEKVTLDTDSISFSAFGRTESFTISKLDELRIREWPMTGKMYIRVSPSGVLQGRYWLQTKQFDDGAELFQALLDIEYHKHPDSIKAKARRVNTEYIEHADDIDRVKAKQRADRRQKVLDATDKIRSVGKGKGKKK